MDSQKQREQEQQFEKSHQNPPNRGQQEISLDIRGNFQIEGMNSRTNRVKSTSTSLPNDKH